MQRDRPYTVITLRHTVSRSFLSIAGTLAMRAVTNKAIWMTASQNILDM